MPRHTITELEGDANPPQSSVDGEHAVPYPMDVRGAMDKMGPGDDLVEQHAGHAADVIPYDEALVVYEEWYGDG